jgi:hypothetical protein
MPETNPIGLIPTPQKLVGPKHNLGGIALEGDADHGRHKLLDGLSMLRIQEMVAVRLQNCTAIDNTLPTFC